MVSSLTQVALRCRRYGMQRALENMLPHLMFGGVGSLLHIVAESGYDLVILNLTGTVLAAIDFDEGGPRAGLRRCTNGGTKEKHHAGSRTHFPRKGAPFGTVR